MTTTFAPASTWTRICSLVDLPKQGGRRASIGDLEFALFRTSNDGVLAVENRCPHKGGKLSEGILTGHDVVCPLHGWKLNLVTGSAVAPDRGCVRRLPVIVKLGQVYVTRSVEPPEEDPRSLEAVRGVDPETQRPVLGSRSAKPSDFTTLDLDRDFPVVSVEPASPATVENFRLQIQSGSQTKMLGLKVLQASYPVQTVATHLASLSFGFTQPVTWSGVRLLDVLEDLGLAGFEFASFHAWETTETPEGERFFETLPQRYALDPRTLLAFGMNGEDLPKEHGGPLRLVVPFLQAYKSVKWLTRITLGITDEVGYKQRHGFHDFPEFYPST